MIGLGFPSSTLHYYLTRNVSFVFLLKLKLPFWMMGRSWGFQKMRKCSFYGVLCVAIVALSLVQLVESQSFDSNNGFTNPADLPLMTQLANEQLYNLSNIMSQDLGNRASFCVKDPQKDWDRAFNFSSNLEFVSSCIQKVQGDPSRRLCTAAEVEFYFDSILERSKSTNFLKLNRNCNLTSWVSGCEPGWACSVGSNEKIDLINTQVIPERTLDCQPCCEGFFCPHGITCMIPCPLGSYCPLAKLNETTGVCEPYLYQLPLGQENRTCGGANIWADVGSSSDIFCPAGSYCPTNTHSNPCSDGHYCRMGSTYEENCFKLSSCNSNREKQNIHVHGIMLLVGLSVLLLVIYNCSDQVLTIRERRIAKSREAAAQSARTRARARQRWKSAKDAAKKNVRQLQVQLSHTFAWKNDLDNPDRVQIKQETDELLSSSHEGTSSVIMEESRNVRVEDIQETHEIENKNGHHIGKGTEDVASEIHIPKGKRATHTQIFNYAYEQLEKERAQEEQNKNLTFSGVIKVAKDVEIKKRPTIEISFKDLTLTLKRKKQHLLRCVTGKIKPGRITAVMGPSGAGKTTFLSALVGKTFGFKMTGSILINGKNDSIHSYKKIIGFVPQDDIVHGNLTVEENLWFSARCRLPAEMSEANKVLVLERVIESLGLQAVRNSLVGTVEKRGISGGQRKRVNVGLEMVMEPSLLILDEPTSGLDSASSMLLLRALRRETQEGVNICMVVHQPSYSLFQMFDELVLLAKGGLIVYHGSTRKVEEYFGSLGINVPERVNPPDHFIDILEGLVKPGTSEVSFKELPVKWMRHKGYTVPPDMQIDEKVVESSGGVDHSDETNLGNDTIAEKSFAGELWNEVRSTMEHKRDKIMHNFLQSKDFSHRRTPGVFRQYKYYLGRVGKQRLRESKLQGIDYLILLLAGACLGSITNVSDRDFGAAGYTYSIIAISLLCKIASLRTFSLDKLQYWRESSSGMSSLAFFIAKDTVDHFNTLVKPAIYLSMFYFFTNPRSSFGENYVVLLCLVYCVTGIAYALAIIFQAGAAQLWSVLLPVVLTLVATQNKDSAFMKFIVDLCYPKWALQAFILANAERYDSVWLITRCAVLQKSGYNINEWGLSLSILIVYGVIFRIIAYISMVTFKKK